MKITEKIPENNLIDSPEKVESTILYFPKCIAVVMKKKKSKSYLWIQYHKQFIHTSSCKAAAMFMKMKEVCHMNLDALINWGNLLREMHIFSDNFLALHSAFLNLHLVSFALLYLCAISSKQWKTQVMHLFDIKAI